MSFSELLQKARTQVADETKMTQKETATETNIITPETEEIKTEANVEPSAVIPLGDAIMKYAHIGLANSKKLKTTNKCKRIAKHLVSGQCKAEHLQKAYEHIMRKRNTNHGDFNLCGGWGTMLFFSYLKSGMSVEQALNQEFKVDKFQRK